MPLKLRAGRISLVLVALIFLPVNTFHEATLLLMVHPLVGWNRTWTWLGITHHSCRL